MNMRVFSSLRQAVVLYIQGAQWNKASTKLLQLSCDVEQPVVILEPVAMPLPTCILTHFLSTRSYNKPIWTILLTIIIILRLWQETCKQLLSKWLEMAELELRTQLYVNSPCITALSLLQTLWHAVQADIAVSFSIIQDSGDLKWLCVHRSVLCCVIAVSLPAKSSYLDLKPRPDH